MEHDFDDRSHINKEFYEIIQKDDLVKLKLFVKKNGIAYKDKSRNSLLHYACMAQWILVCPKTQLYKTEERTNIAIANFLIKAGSEVNAKNKNGHTPLHLACKYGHAKLVHTLLQNQADIHARADSSCEDTPLGVAVREHCYEVVKVLIENGVKE